MRFKSLIKPMPYQKPVLVLTLLCFMSMYQVVFAGQPPAYEVLAGEQRFTVEVALSEEQRRLGLMHRRELPDGYGLLMVLGRSRIIPIWMKNMQFPLDVVWIDSGGQIVDKATLPICKQTVCQVYTPNTPARYVLEVGAGRFLLNIGDKVEILDASGDSLHPPDPGLMSRPEKL